MLKNLSTKPDFPVIEEEVLTFWKKNKIFEKSIENRSINNSWTFLDGPPFITGLPHYGSLLSSIPKDLYPRYHTMKGKRVRRVWGWDCHGLPAENKVEEKLGIKRKRDIEAKIGIERFITECKNYVSTVSRDWQWYIDHVGRFVDFEGAYRTMDLSYMETVMWVFSELYKKQLIYKDLRVSLYCPHCATPISNFEVAMDEDNYRSTTDPATIYKYELSGEKNTYILAWSTTPWNKIVTPALAVSPKIDYVKVRQGKENYILAKNTLPILNNEPYEIVSTLKGKDLIGRSFAHHYDYYSIDKGKQAFVIIGGDFVTDTEGTGVVTIAAYGEEDLLAMKENNIHIELHLDEEGTVRSSVPIFGGKHYLAVNEEVNLDLASRGLIYKDDKLIHAVPHCWRCSTRLYYSPQDAWFVDIQQLKPKLRRTLKATNWFPAHFKQGRFAKSMEAAPDWCISRSRYWGSPVPVWECSCTERFVPSSIAELEQVSGTKISDLHRPVIDNVKVKCKNCGKQANRVKEVLDSWIEAGSAPYGERHFPFDPKIKLGDFFPPDFIVEYTGQIRAWFYVLHVLSTALFDSHAFNNVIVTGVILGTDGRKMSKNFGNYPDPKEMLGKYGGDALRLYLMGSPVMTGEDIRISEAEYRLQLRELLIPYWNIYRFFANASEEYDFDPERKVVSDNILDSWILSRMNSSIKQVQKSLDQYNTSKAVSQVKDFVVSHLSMWYLRRIKEHLRPEEDAKIIKGHLSTLYTVLESYTRVMAPVVPFITEHIYQSLTDQESVHLQDWPVTRTIDDNLEREMEIVRELSSMLHAIRKGAGVKVRIPLRQATYKGPERLSESLMTIVKEEANLYDLKYEGESKELGVEVSTADSNLDKEAGLARELIRQIQQERKKLGLTPEIKIIVTLNNWPKEYEDQIVRRTNAVKLQIGSSFEVSIK